MSASLPFTVMPCPCCGSMKIAISTTTNALTNLPRNDRPVCLECGVRAETLEAWNKRTARPEVACMKWPDSIERKLPIEDRIKAALQRIRDGHANMRIPADETDVDWVLADCLTLLSSRSPQLRSQEKP